jgi:FtsP/CotA-like multicopper oxidase with cupredoxin domain
MANKRDIDNARKNRLELIKAGLTRRDLVRMGLITSAGFLVAKDGLSSRAWGYDHGHGGGGGDGGGGDGGGAHSSTSPPTRVFIEPLPLLTVKQPVASLDPLPTIAPNTAAGEGRTVSHQALTAFPPQKFYVVTQREGQVSMSPDLPMQTIWGYDGIAPGPVYHARYGEPILVRNVNNLPADNGGFGNNTVSTHLHNGHTPSESDGFPCYFFRPGQFYDHHYPNVLAGFTDPQFAAMNGDVRESLSTLFYHDHRIDFTAQNVYKGLVGQFLLFNDHDTGDETTGFHLPSGEFDVPMMFGDKVFDPNTGKLFFDLFNLDGILGDKFLVNGKIQPFFQVHPRRYRLRWTNTGPSRWHQFFLTDLDNLNANNRFWQIANDGNLLPAPVQVSSVELGVAERADVIIDFSRFKPGQSIYLENRLEQNDGRGPTGNVLAAGQGNFVLRFDIVLPAVTDNSADPVTARFYDLPPINLSNAVTRTFRFERGNGQWQINGRFADCNVNRFTVKRNSTEIWTLVNNSGGWMHPIHIHFEEHRILSRNGAPPPLAIENTRKDVVELHHNEAVQIFFRFRDFTGRYPLHCHNVVHEDHAMMALWSIAPDGDTNPQP